MAAAAIILAENPCTIESDSTGAVITNTGLQGTLVNGGSTSVFLKTSVTDTAATAPATSNAQAQHTVELPAGASMPILAHYKTMYQITASGTSVLFWYPHFTRFP